MKLIDLIDMEAQLAWDREAEPSRLGERDAAIARRLSGTERADPERAVAAWLEALREAEAERRFPGRRVERALRLVAAALVVFGFASGAGLASALLAYDGTRPINVMDFLWAVVGVQLALLFFLLASLAAPGALGRAPLVGDARAFVAWVYPRLASRLGGARGEAFAAAFHRLRSRRSLYARVEPWLLLGLTQLFGVAFNLGVLLALLRLVVLTDLAFAWATTLDLEAAELHRAVRTLSMPWAWAFPEAAPSLSLVEATRYSRLEGAYLAGGGAVRAGGWWPFLVAATATYGLLPRTLAWLVARVQRARLLASVRFDDVETRRLLARLTGPVVETRGEGGQVQAPPIDGSAALPSLDLGKECAVVLYRDVPVDGERLARALRAKLGSEVKTAVKAGGMDADADRRALVALDVGVPVVVVAEAWEPPDKGLLRFLRELREALDARRPVLVGLVGVAEDGGWSAPTEDDVAVWRERVATLADPFLGIERLEDAS